MMGFETAARPRTGPQNASCAGGLPLTCAAGNIFVIVFVFDVGDKRWDGKLEDGINSRFEEDGWVGIRIGKSSDVLPGGRPPTLLPEHYYLTLWLAPIGPSQFKVSSSKFKP
jgi:hypothetical protein